MEDLYFDGLWLGECEIGRKLEAELCWTVECEVSVNKRKRIIEKDFSLRIDIITIECNRLLKTLLNNSWKDSINCW